MPAKIAVIYYSLYGHVTVLAKEAVKGAAATGAKVDLYQFPETLSEEILGKMYAAPKDKTIPTITPDALKEYDGIIFAFPTRYGRAVAQVSAFFDATGGLWMTGGLVGKFAATITSTAGLQGGQETTHLTTVPYFTHHGMIYVPLGYTQPALLTLDEIHGGSPWGASTFAKSDGSRQPSEIEKGIAEGQGKHFANIVNTFVAGKASLAAKSTSTDAGYSVPQSAESKPTTNGEKAPAAGTTPTLARKAPTKADNEVEERKGWKKYVCC